MDTTNYLMMSDVASAVTASAMQGLQDNKVTNSLWKPFIYNLAYSVAGRMFEEKLTGDSFNRADNKDGTPGGPIIRTAEGRSSLIIAISAGIVAMIMKTPNKMLHVLTAVSSDVLGDQLIGSFTDGDSVIWAKKKAV